jgi:hypothetical protein
VPWLTLLVACLSLRRPGFDPIPVYWRFVADRVALKQAFLRNFDYPLSISSHQCAIVIFNYMLFLPEGPMLESWEPSENNALSEIGGHWIEKFFQFFSLKRVSLLPVVPDEK